MRAFTFASMLLVAGAARAAIIEVSQGPGTPLQDAVDAASPNDRILVHAGDYLETVVIDRSLRVYADGAVRLGPELGPNASSCTPPYVLDVAGDRVRVKGPRGRNVSFSVQGGATSAVRIRGNLRVHLSKLDGLSFCSGASGLEVEAPSDVRIQRATFTSQVLSLVGAPGCRVAHVVGRTLRMKGVVRRAPTGPNGGAGLLLGDVMAAQAPGTVGISGSVLQGDVGVALQRASGVVITDSFLLGTAVLGGPLNSSVSLDAASTGNLEERSMLQGPVTDAGSNNCLRSNVDENRTPLPDSCSSM